MPQDGFLLFQLAFKFHERPPDRGSGIPSFFVSRQRLTWDVARERSPVELPAPLFFKHHVNRDGVTRKVLQSLFESIDELLEEVSDMALCLDMLQFNEPFHR